MFYFTLSLIIGLCLLALLLTVFFKAGKKNRKQSAADLQLVQNSGDEGLIHLYQQAESENEREGIIEFIKEKLAKEEPGFAEPSVDLAPAGNLEPEPIPEAVAANQPQPEHDEERRNIQGLTGAILDNNITEPLAQAATEDYTAYGQPGNTHMMALETVDWQAIETEMQQRRAEEARIMAHNQQIQEVFSKIRKVEESLTATQQANNDD